MAIARLNLKTRSIYVDHVATIYPILPTGKQVRQNSLDLESAFQLYSGAISHLMDAHAVFVEVPIGSQSARAMASYGICVGVLGSLRASHIPFYEVTPTEVKLAGAGSKSASKESMIDWAIQRHPEAPIAKSKAKAEHQADAIATIHAGVKLTAFQQLLSMTAN